MSNFDEILKKAGEEFKPKSDFTSSVMQRIENSKTHKKSMRRNSYLISAATVAALLGFGISFSLGNPAEPTASNVTLNLKIEKTAQPTQSTSASPVASTSPSKANAGSDIRAISIDIDLSIKAIELELAQSDPNLDQTILEELNQ